MKPAIKAVVRPVLRTLGLWPYVQKRWQLWRQRAYQRWLETEDMSSPTGVATSPFVFSIVVPVHKYLPQYLMPLIRSVQAQSYRQWQLVIVNACEDAADASAVSEVVRQDARIVEVRLPRNEHIARNTNAGIAAATGQYVALLDYDDTIAPFALAEMAARATADESIDAFYSDEDKLSDDGRTRLYPFFKPDYSEELIRTSNYICHFLTVRRTILSELSGIRTGFDGAQDYDLVLRLISRRVRWCHIPRMSYHWRMAAGSTAGEVATTKPYVVAAGYKALTEYLARENISAQIEAVTTSATYHLTYQDGAGARVGLIGTNQIVQAFTNQEVRFIPVTDLAAARTAKVEYVMVMPQTVSLVEPEHLVRLVARAAIQGTGFVSPAAVDTTGFATAGYLKTGQFISQLRLNQADPEFLAIGMSNWPRQFLAVSPSCFVVSMAHLSGLEALEPAAILRQMLRIHHLGARNIFWPAVQVRGSANNETFTAYPVPDEFSALTDPASNPHISVRRDRVVLI